MNASSRSFLCLPPSVLLVLKSIQCINFHSPSCLHKIYILLDHLPEANSFGFVATDWSTSVSPAQMKTFLFIKTCISKYFCRSLGLSLWTAWEFGLVMEQITLSQTDTWEVCREHWVSVWGLGDSPSYLVWLRRPAALDPQLRCQLYKLSLRLVLALDF